MTDWIRVPEVKNAIELIRKFGRGGDEGLIVVDALEASERENAELREEIEQLKSARDKMKELNDRITAFNNADIPK
jgi:hypothetical protein